MQIGFVAAGEQPGGFEHDINAQFFPRQIRRVALLQHLNFMATDDNIFVVVTDLAVELAVHRIPFEQMGQRMRVSEIVDREHALDLFL